MPCNIKITIDDVAVDAVLNDSPTALAIRDILPIVASVNTWGDEIYFEIPVDMPLDSTAKEVVEMGDIGYWPRGKAFCVFFGPTPISQPGEIRPASAVNIIGKVVGDPTSLKSVQDGRVVRIEKKD